MTDFFLSKIMKKSCHKVHILWRVPLQQVCLYAQHLSCEVSVGVLGVIFLAPITHRKFRNVWIHCCMKSYLIDDLLCGDQGVIKLNTSELLTCVKVMQWMERCGKFTQSNAHSRCCLFSCLCGVI